ncbi:MAG: efflux RND transporter permease subunit [Campylobacterota bacterium]|nr:efflux RND transporter permease subunit [Campylobacterota bacterium]
MSPVFFIKRPIFAMVIAILTVILGTVSMSVLSIEQYPNVTPPTVAVSATFTGANAYDVEETVTRPLEDKLNGVQGMIYIESSSTSAGESAVNIYFEPGYDLDIAAVDVQNKVELAKPSLPSEVKQSGVSVDKKSPSIVCLIGVSGTENYTDAFLSNYININILDEIKRIPGVGEAKNMGEKKYSMRIWLDPDKMKSMGMTPMQIISAVQDQNKQAALGKIGAAPGYKDQQVTYTLTADGRLKDAQEFGKIVLKYNKDGSLVYLKDVSDIELGAEKYDWNALLNSSPVGLIAIYQLAGANALEIKAAVVKKMDDLKERFPEGISYSIPYDTTKYVEVAIDNVIVTLIVAIFLVILVIYIFLQNWRPTVIATVAIPVALIGAFIAMYATGFSINFLTLFGLILAIGIVVDDVILVVENVETIMTDEPDLPMPHVVKKAMAEITGPIIATTLVLVAVFVPVSMMPGITGSLYQQFALTISFAVIISSVNALSLSPAIAAIIIKRRGVDKKEFKGFELFNRGFDWTTVKYETAIRFFVKIKWLVVIAFIALIGYTAYMFKTIPTGFVPEEDQGVALVGYNLKPGAANVQTEQIAAKIENTLKEIKAIRDITTINGFNIVTGSLDPSAGVMFLTFHPWEERDPETEGVNAIIKQIFVKTASITDAKVFAFNLPGIPGLGATGGFDFRVQDYMSSELTQFQTYVNELIVEANKDPRIGAAYTTFNASYPMYYVDFKRDKINALGVNLSDVFLTMQTYLGSFYINDFSKYGKVYRVFVQAKKEFRSNKADISKLFVQNNKADMVPLSALITINSIDGPQNITHYNLYRSIQVSGFAAPGYSSGDAMAAMEETQQRVMPKEYGFQWSGMSLQEKEAGNAIVMTFVFVIIVVFMVLAAQYESWILPLMIMIPVPLVMLGALLGLKLAGLPMNVFAQIGLVLLIAMSSKNAILIVEFAKELRESGKSIADSAIEAAVSRFRPILMTILSFIFGIFPLALATGAGAVTQKTIGISLLGGMTIATLVALFIVPVIYVLLETMRELVVDVEEEVRMRESL